MPSEVLLPQLAARIAEHVEHLADRALRHAGAVPRTCTETLHPFGPFEESRPQAFAQGREAEIRPPDDQAGRDQLFQDLQVRPGVQVVHPELGESRPRSLWVPGLGRAALLGRRGPASS